LQEDRKKKLENFVDKMTLTTEKFQKKMKELFE